MALNGSKPAVDATDGTILALWPTAYRIARLILRDAMMAEDVAQESCVRALQRRSQIRDASALEPWFRSLVTHLALSARRRVERRRKREAPVDERTEMASVSFDPSTAVDLAAAIERLGDDLRLPLILVYYGGSAGVEVARQLAIAPATVRYRLAVARNALRPLGDYGPCMRSMAPSSTSSARSPALPRPLRLRRFDAERTNGAPGCARFGSARWLPRFVWLPSSVPRSRPQGTP